MRITASIGVIDEIECLESCVDYHASIGIDTFVITDLGSTDGTGEVLRRLARRENVRVLEAGQNMAESAWPAAMQRHAYECFQPDYIVYIDPDEFWLPAAGKLSAVCGESDVIVPARYNVIPDARLAAGDWRMHDPLDQRIVFRERLRWSPGQQLDFRTPIVRYAPGPKVMHRAVPAAIARGWHAVHSELLQKTVSPRDLVILHFPVSTYDRFRRKVVNAARHLEENRDHLKPGEAWHWRIYVQAHQDGLLRESYDCQVFSEEQIASFLRDGIACMACDLFDK
jgi:hypothetical protein